MKKSSTDSEREAAFACGVVYALARVVEMFDEPTIAAEVLRESGVDVRHADDYDVQFLRKQNPKLPRGKR